MSDHIHLAKALADGVYSASKNGSIDESKNCSEMTTTAELPEDNGKDGLQFDAQPANTADTVEVDPNGDLHLSVGPKNDLFLVCSRTLSRSSRYWKNVLYGPFASSKPPPASSDRTWLKHLPDDDPTALGLILTLIHRPFEPPSDLRAIKLDVLHGIASLIERYEWGHLLRMHGWSKEVVRRLDYVKRPMVVQLAHSQVPISLFDEVLKGLWVSWAVGSASHFGQFAAAIARQVTADEQGELTHPHTGVLLEDSGLMPNKEMIGEWLRRYYLAHDRLGYPQFGRDVHALE
jgi:hypothetical protein